MMSQGRNLDAPSKDDGEVATFGEVLAVILEYRWMIFLFALAASLAGAGYALLSEPRYRASGLIQVEERSSSMPSIVKEIEPIIGTSLGTSVAAEQEILASRLVLGKVIENLKLDVVAEPSYFPIFGRFVANRLKSDTVKEPWLGLSSYAWGGEEVDVAIFTVPRDRYDYEFKIINKNQGNFQVVDQGGVVILEGAVGTKVLNGDYSIKINKLRSYSDTEFSLVRRSPDEAVLALTKNYVIKEKGKQKSGILEVSYVGTDREEIGETLKDVFDTYVQQNIERRSAEAENTLRFLEGQVPIVKHQLDIMEAAYNNYRRSRGSLDLGVETQSVLSTLSEIETQIVSMRLERDELRQYFTAEHPRLKATDMKLDKLLSRKAEFEKNVGRLPDTQQNILRLARDVEATANVYTSILNTVQQLKVSKAGVVGDVRVIDPVAVSDKPIGLKPSVIVLISLTVGTVIGLIVVWLLRSLKVVVSDPSTIESSLGIQVLSTIPHSSIQDGYERRKGGGLGANVLAIQAPNDDSIESLRSLRTNLHFLLSSLQRNSVLIAGPRPGVGKSFISTNLAVVIAQSGAKVVLVDADIRKGRLHKLFGVERSVGISEYVMGSATIDEITKPTSIANMWIVSTGVLLHDPSGSLVSQRLQVLVSELERVFDYVIIDTAPILAVSDAAIVGRNVGVTLMVARSDMHPLAELEQAVKQFKQSEIAVDGFVFNDFDVSRQKYRYGYAGYLYKYSYKGK